MVTSTTSFPGVIYPQNLPRACLPPEVKCLCKALRVFIHRKSLWHKFICPLGKLTMVETRFSNSHNVTCQWVKHIQQWLSNHHMHPAGNYHLVYHACLMFDEVLMIQVLHIMFTPFTVNNTVMYVQTWLI